MSSYEAGVFDFYDDRGVILQNEIPDADTLPEFVKTASMMGPEDSPQLYALVMLDDGKILKKYATADRGNTWLSTLYFFHTKDNLPLEAQKVAAANLVEACEAFDIDAPDCWTGRPVTAAVPHRTSHNPSTGPCTATSASRAARRRP